MKDNIDSESMNETTSTPSCQSLDIQWSELEWFGVWLKLARPEAECSGVLVPAS
jgi:hypothetical protein